MGLSAASSAASPVQVLVSDDIDDRDSQLVSDDIDDRDSQLVSDDIDDRDSQLVSDLLDDRDSQLGSDGINTVPPADTLPVLGSGDVTTVGHNTQLAAVIEDMEDVLETVDEVIQPQDAPNASSRTSSSAAIIQPDDIVVLPGDIPDSMQPPCLLESDASSAEEPQQPCTTTPIRYHFLQVSSVALLG
ncbi:hypothetical protein C8Q76DRAFT_795184 [Earliella scabrosa]|nr:hypothetical protein C8Q76DRAFT_795184 [Earliella scabrosa]